MTGRLGPYLLGPNDTPENGIYTGDARELAKAIPDESVDLIFTDPPYAQEYVGLYGAIAESGARILRPGSLCIAFCGQFMALRVGELMSQHLAFFWLGGMQHTSPIGSVFPRKMWASWKPIWWFQKPGELEKSWTFDLFTPSKADKKYHGWGQPADHAIYYILRLTTLTECVLDPFTGGGTVPAVCKMLGRKYLAFEIEADMADIARERVRKTQMPLFVLEPEQERMQLE